LNVQAYLDRIHADVAFGPTFDPTLEALSILHERHLRAAPFENLDIVFGVPIVLDQAAILEKVVDCRRGGFCYELNSAFAWLLSQLGYHVTMLSAQVARADGQFGHAFDHMTLRVDIGDAAWLADVGFGECFARPIPLSDTADGDYRLTKNGDTWLLVHGTTPKYRFTLTPRTLPDFVDACNYQQTSPESTFTQRVVTTRLTPSGRVTLTRERLVVSAFQAGAERIETKINNDAEWFHALKNHFDIVPERVT
jgi:N-hydroxyarylamine O-acetyltransferase